MSKINSLFTHFRINSSSFIELLNTINIMKKTFFRNSNDDFTNYNCKSNIILNEFSIIDHELDQSIAKKAMNDNKSTIIDDLIDNVNKKTYYRNVNLFNDKIKNIIEINDTNIFKLFDVEKQLIKFENNVDH